MKIVLIYNSSTISYAKEVRYILEKIFKSHEIKKCTINSNIGLEYWTKYIDHNETSMFIIFDDGFISGKDFFEQKIEQFKKFNKKIFIAKTGGESINEKELNEYKNDRSNCLLFGMINPIWRPRVKKRLFPMLEQVDKVTISKIGQWKEGVEVFNFLMALKRRNDKNTLPKIPKCLLLWMFQRNFSYLNII